MISHGYAVCTVIFMMIVVTLDSFAIVILTVSSGYSLVLMSAEFNSYTGKNGISCGYSN